MTKETHWCWWCPSTLPWASEPLSLGFHSSSGSPQVVFALSCTPTSLCANLLTHKNTNPEWEAKGGCFIIFYRSSLVSNVYCNTVIAANTFAHLGIWNVVEPENPSTCNRCDICTLTSLVFYPTEICVMYHANVPRALDCICSSSTLEVAVVCLTMCLLVRLVI